MRVHAEVCHDNGIASVHYSPQGYCLYTGGEKGEIGMFDLRMMRMVEVSLRPNLPPQRRLGAEILALRVRHSKRTSRRCSPSAFRRISGTSTRARKTARSRCDRICFPLLGLGLTICLLARCGSRVRLRPQSLRSRTRTCGTPVREQLRAPRKCPGFCDAWWCWVARRCDGALCGQGRIARHHRSVPVRFQPPGDLLRGGRPRRPLERPLAS